MCSEPIVDRILRANGKPYHPKCFTCVVCAKSLEGIQFTIDAANRIYCIEDFHKYDNLQITSLFLSTNILLSMPVCFATS